jgi:hypothetical protein
MKKILVAILAAGLLSLPAIASNDGGKKKARKKAKMECKKDNSCDPKTCPFPPCPPQAEEKCTEASKCTGNK